MAAVRNVRLLPRGEAVSIFFDIAVSRFKPCVEGDAGCRFAALIVRVTLDKRRRGCFTSKIAPGLISLRHHGQSPKRQICCELAWSTVGPFHGFPLRVKLEGIFTSNKFIRAGYEAVGRAAA